MYLINTQNAINSWVELAPKQVRFNDGLYCFAPDTKDEFTSSLHGFLVWRKQWLLIGYIQHLMELNGWDWDRERNKVQDFTKVIVWTDDILDTKYFGTGSPCKALLYAYVNALGNQRLVKPGQWKHFKGGVFDVIGSARCYTNGDYESSGYIGYAEYLGLFAAEESPERMIRLFRHRGELIYIQMNPLDRSDRVFYTHDSKNWSRKIDSFLGLVGRQHPDHEGKLRFAFEGLSNG